MHRSPFDHLTLTATEGLQASITERAEKTGIAITLIDHGYCWSLYRRDPDELAIELVVDNPDALAAAPALRAHAHA